MSLADHAPEAFHRNLTPDRAPTARSWRRTARVRAECRATTPARKRLSGLLAKLRRFSSIAGGSLRLRPRGYDLYACPRCRVDAARARSCRIEVVDGNSGVEHVVSI